MADETRLTPDQARALFGDLLEPKTRTYRHFGKADGSDWRPHLESGKLVEYRLHPPVRTEKIRPSYRPKGK